MTRKILFISHDATRTGAPFLILNFLKWLKDNNHTGIQIEIFLKDSGPLEEEFRQIGKVKIWNQSNFFIKYRIPFLGKFYSRLKKRLLINYFQAAKPNLIYANSVASASLISKLKSYMDIPVICHVHELQMSIKRYCGLSTFKAACPHINHFVAASNAVKNNLISRHSIPEQDISIVYEYIVLEELKAAQNKAIHNRSIMLDDLGIPQEAIIVGGAGTMDWRKAPDLFVQVANTIIRSGLSVPVYFLWIGSATAPRQQEELEYDLDQLGIKEYVRFLGSKTNPHDYINLYDIFLLTSREDPFPVVCLEAAGMGKPILCFDKAGGMSEFVEKGGGDMVPYLNTNMMASKLLEYILDKSQRIEQGKRAEKEIAESYNTEYAGTEILRIINKFLS